MSRESFFTLFVSTDDERDLIIEPLGESYRLVPEDSVLMHVYGDAIGHPPKENLGNTDINVAVGPGHVTIFLDSIEYDAWNKAGKKLTL